MQTIYFLKAYDSHYPLTTWWSWITRITKFKHDKCRICTVYSVYLCVSSKCLQEDCAISLVAFFTFLHCAFSNVSSNRMPEKRHSRIGCICLTFPHCSLSNVSLYCPCVRMQSHTGCICLTFLHCVFLNVSSNLLLEMMQNYIGGICLAFLHCAFSNAFSNDLCERLCTHIGCTHLTSYLVQFLQQYWYRFQSNHNCQDFDPLPPRARELMGREMEGPQRFCCPLGTDSFKLKNLNRFKWESESEIHL